MHDGSSANGAALILYSGVVVIDPEQSGTDGRHKSEFHMFSAGRWRDWQLVRNH